LVELLPRHGWSSLIDEVLASASVVFLLSVAFSYAAIRLGHRARRLETYAELIFLTGLVMIIASALVLAYDVR